MLISGPKTDPWLGPAISPIKAVIISPFVDQQMQMFIAQVNHENLETLAEMASNGVIKSVIDRRYTLDEIAEAMQYLGTQRARGKVVIDIAPTERMQMLGGA